MADNSPDNSLDNIDDEGLRVTQDYEEALKFYRAAVEKGVREAYSELELLSDARKACQARKLEVKKYYQVCV
jgi:TPR repeat protein